MGEWAEFGLVAAAVGLGAFTLLALAARRRPAPAAGPDPDAEPGGLVASLAGDLAPGRGRDVAEIQPLLLRAGFYAPTDLARYRVIRALLVLAPLAGAGVVAVTAPRDRVPAAAAAGLAFAALGYSLPRVYVAARARARARQTERGLPVLADLLTLALLGGQSLLGALRRTAAEVRPAYPVIGEELDLVVRQAELTSLPHAVQRWADRSQVPDVRNLAMVVAQAQRMGADVSGALMEFANAMRANARQRADAQAQRAGLWIMFPNILCLWVPAAVILIAPLVFEFRDRRAKAREAIQKQVGGEDLSDSIRRAGEKSRPGPDRPTGPGRPGNP